MTISEDKINLLTPFFIILLVFFIPISSTIKSILIPLCVITLLFTPYYQRYLYFAFNTLWARAALILFLYVVLASFWSEAPFSMRYNVIDKYLKLVFLPILTLAFVRPKTRTWALNSYLLVMLLTCVLSILKSKNLIVLNSSDPGEVFYNHIVTSFMVALGVYIALILTAADEELWKRLYYLTMILLGSYQILFINTGRSGYIAYSIFISFFILQKLSIKKALISISAFTAAIMVAYFISPVMHDRTNQLINEIRSLSNGGGDTSLSLRVKYHHYANSLFKEHPIMGVGTGGFQYHYLKDQPIPSKPKLNEPHGQFWLIYAEGGEIGMMLYLFFLGALYFTALKLKKSKPILIGLLLVFCIMSISDTVFCYSPIGYLLILFCALCFGELVEESAISQEPAKEKYVLRISWEAL